MTNKVAVELIQRYEGCKLTAYKDMVGVWTIGWGHTGPDVHAGLKWTQAEADAALVKEMDKFAAAVNRLVIVELSEGQEAALISFAYNLGEGALTQSALLKAVNQRSWISAALQFQRWCHAGGKEVRGLLIRRFDEALTFIKASK